jgi:hypothetical protein
MPPVNAATDVPGVRDLGTFRRRGLCHGVRQNKPAREPSPPSAMQTQATMFGIRHISPVLSTRQAATVRLVALYRVIHLGQVKWCA